MTNHDEQEIRERAYALWEKEGSPHGRDIEFWERARLLVQAPEQPASEQAGGAAQAPTQPLADKEIDEAMEETFPASDPPAFTADRGPITKKPRAPRRPKAS